VPQDHAEAVRWFRRAAEQDLRRAQYNLGLRYANGEGVPQDRVEAVMWFTLAAADPQERAKAIENRDRVAAEMTAADIAEAERRAREWSPARRK
jgi:uncharacterized protein